MLDTAFSVFLVQVKNDFAVARRSECVPELPQRLAQFPVIVYLAIADEPEGFVFVCDRLLTAREVNDGKPDLANLSRRIKDYATVIRSPVLLRVEHPMQQVVATVLRIN